MTIEIGEVGLPVSMAKVNPLRDYSFQKMEMERWFKLQKPHSKSKNQDSRSIFKLEHQLLIMFAKPTPMEPRETQFSHFDLLWLKELSLNEQETLNTMIRSFVNHVPAMIKEVKDALDENSVDKLQESVRRVSSVASMFTRKDYSRLLILGKEKSSQLSLYTVQQVNNLIDDLATLQKEVSYYHNFSTSSGPKARRSSHR